MMRFVDASFTVLAVPLYFREAKQVHELYSAGLRGGLACFLGSAA